MINYEFQKGAEHSSATNETIWAFDLQPPLRREQGEDRGEVSNPFNRETRQIHEMKWPQRNAPDAQRLSTLN